MIRMWAEKYQNLESSIQFKQFQMNQSTISAFNVHDQNYLNQQMNSAAVTARVEHDQYKSSLMANETEVVDRNVKDVLEWPLLPP